MRKFDGYMNSSGEIIIRIKGHSKNGPLTPDNYDIRELKDLLSIVENLIDSFYPADVKRLPVSYEVKKGSVVNIFRTSKQIAVSVMAVASMIGASNSLEGVEYRTAKAFCDLQKSAVSKGYTYEFSGSEYSESVLNISPESKLKMAKKPDIESSYSVLLDTSFLIRLLKADDPLHANAKAYFRYFIENDVEMYISTISIAEYCVKGSFDDLPFQVCRIMPFNIQHAPIAGKYASVIFESANKISTCLITNISE